MPDIIIQKRNPNKIRVSVVGRREVVRYSLWSYQPRLHPFLLAFLLPFLFQRLLVRSEVALGSVDAYKDEDDGQGDERQGYFKPEDALVLERSIASGSPADDFGETEKEGDAQVHV